MPRIDERGEDCLKVASSVLLVAVGLLNQDTIGCSVPDARPALIGPAKAKGKVRLAGGQHLGKGSFKDSTAFKPVMPVAESLNPVLLRECALLRACLRDAQIVVAKL